MATEQLMKMATRINTYKALQNKATETIAQMEKQAKEERQAINRIHTKQRTLLLQQQFNEKSEEIR
jgi:cellobiose-specific phosphotransferase system component IIA